MNVHENNNQGKIMSVEDQTIDIVLELRVHVARKYKRARSAAIAWGCSDSFVSLVLTGKAPPPEWMLEDAGFKKIHVPAVTKYEKA